MPIDTEFNLQTHLIDMEGRLSDQINSVNTIVGNAVIVAAKNGVRIDNLENDMKLFKRGIWSLAVAVASSMGVHIKEFFTK